MSDTKKTRHKMLSGVAAPINWQPKMYKIQRDENGAYFQVPLSDLSPEMREMFERSFANNGGADEKVAFVEHEDGSLALDLGPLVKKAKQ
jgi:hypothetical protein